MLFAGDTFAPTLQKRAESQSHDMTRQVDQSVSESLPSFP